MLMTEQEAAAYLGITPRTLCNARANGNGPAFHRLNHKIIRYDPADLDAYLAATKIRPQKTAA